ncbi:MAG TPA: ATP-binding cassette domain-containing protein [Candidatus Eisenbergiella merdipullorum]|uniref:ATP-binding cassette domain-containing protein n=1 Tax=Candidatus Eisenbergiella merdipullorum TaxID=2838553 RepID=A0A9D2I932_9FIRM|nr:ATP-binding cassette domain-containing protein [Candidatus Eisenbergiella merdipullorum]
METPIIQIRNVSKTFQTKDGKIEALKQISLNIGAGEIYGIIGMSGAGKSTLVRCLNFLEKPTEGTVLIDGVDLAGCSDKELRKVRNSVAMIFQHFNLLMQRTVLDNVCFALEILGTKKKEARQKAKEILKIVDLEQKADAYPAQLSGGQKQRVAIARALAMNPRILLCDEATSALDPRTTRSILELLSKINKEYGITIVIITHEMSVVQEICSHVAIIDSGSLVETGTVEEVFTSPRSKAAKRLVFQGSGGENPASRALFAHAKTPLMTSRHCVRIVFTENSSFEPVIANMVLECGAPVNILHADTQDVGGTARGQMVLQLPEDAQTAEKMIRYLKDRKLTVEELDGYVE